MVPQIVWFFFVPEMLYIFLLMLKISVKPNTCTPKTTTMNFTHTKTKTNMFNPFYTNAMADEWFHSGYSGLCKMWWLSVFCPLRLLLVDSLSSVAIFAYLFYWKILLYVVVFTGFPRNLFYFCSMQWQNSTSNSRKFSETTIEVFFGLLESPINKSNSLECFHLLDSLKLALKLTFKTPSGIHLFFVTAQHVM